MTDEEIIEEAQALFSSDEVIIQEPGVEGPEQIVDRIEGGAWVMAWVWVPNTEGDKAA